ncbi:MAG: thiamine-phosphate kinase [Bacteroidetes bacterium]|nr:MAG: thiamine-phosphate kinase [Bacteroidota bacterium]
MSSLTPVSSLGEFGLIERLTRNFPEQNPDVLRRIGDDAAVVRTSEGEVQVFSTDLLLEGVHFDLAYVPLRHLGYKAVSVNVSDIAAMNARAYGITVSIAVSSRFSIEALDELYKGIRQACKNYGVELLGGDTSSSRQGMVISVTAFGKAAESDIIYRSGAREKDLICVTGDVGAAYAGLLVLDREKAVYLKNANVQPDLDTYDYVMARQLKPEARVDMAVRFAEMGIRPTAMMDVSDGIASELHHLCRQSGTGATIYAAKLPIDPQTVSVAEEFSISPVTFALNGGEDYELIFTIPLSDFEKIQTQTDITVIGHMTADPKLIQIVMDSGEVLDIQAQGFRHF